MDGRVGCTDKQIEKWPLCHDRQQKSVPFPYVSACFGGQRKTVQTEILLKHVLWICIKKRAIHVSSWF